MGLETIQKITLDFTVPRIKNVRCIEDDSNSRTIKINITNNGEAYPLDSGSMDVKYKIHKPDHTYIYNAVPIDNDGGVTIKLPDQAMAVPGISKSELQVSESKNGKIISTMPFNIIVEKSVLTSQDIISKSESDVFGNIIEHITDHNNPHKVTAEQLNIHIATETDPGLVKSGTDIEVDVFGNVSVKDYSHLHYVNNIKDLSATSTELNYSVGVTSGIQDQIDSKADIDSPVLIGIPKAPTPPPGTETEQIATTEFVQDVKNSLDTDISGKVDKVDGKGLSTNDYTDTDKNKLDGIESGAEVNVKSDWNETDQSSDSYIENKPKIPSKPEDVGAAPSTHAHPNATITDPGFMFSSDKEKLDGIEAGANKYIHPSTHPASMISQDSTHRFVTDNEKTAWNKTYEQSTKYIDGKIADLIGTADEAMNTLGELSDAIKKNGDTVKAINDAIGKKANQSELDTHVNNSTIHVTATDKENWNKDIAEREITFAPATTRTNISTGDKLKTILGKIAKWFSDLKTVAFTGSYNDLKDKPSIPPEYTHPTYTGKTSGLYKIAVDGTGHVSATTAVKKSDITALGIPGTDTDTTYDEATSSKSGLMSAADKAKIDGIATGANKYVHPNYTSKVNGLYKITVDGSGHVSETSLAKKTDITALGIPSTDTTYSTGTASTGGITKLYGNTGSNTDGTMTQRAITDELKNKASSNHTHSYNDLTDKPSIPSAYVHPTTSGHKHIPSGGTSGQILRWAADGTATWGTDNDTTYGVATANNAGLMSAADKAKLDTIASGATSDSYTHPAYTSRTSGLYKITVDGTGHVSNTSSVTKNDITALGISDNSHTHNNYLPLSGGTMTGSIILNRDGTNPTASIIQKQANTSHCTDLAMWDDGLNGSNKYLPGINRFNKGGDGTGSIILLPYATNATPYNGNVGLYIGKNILKLDGENIPTQDYLDAHYVADYISAHQDTFPSKGWYRIALYSASGYTVGTANAYAELSCDITIKRSWHNSSPDFHCLQLLVSNNSTKFVSIAHKNTNAFTKMRLTLANGKVYIEAYYNLDTFNRAYYSIDKAKGLDSSKWTAIALEAVGDTYSGMTVLASIDFPDDFDLGNPVGLEKFHTYYLQSSTANLDTDLKNFYDNLTDENFVVYMDAGATYRVDGYKKGQYGVLRKCVYVSKDNAVVTEQCACINGIWGDWHKEYTEAYKPTSDEIGAAAADGSNVNGMWRNLSSGTVYGEYTQNGGSQPPAYIPKNRVKFNMMRQFKGLADISNAYMDCMLMDCYEGNDVPYVTGFGMAKAGGIPRAFIAVGSKGNTTTWGSQAELITTANYQDYLTGGGSSESDWIINSDATKNEMDSTDTYKPGIYELADMDTGFSGVGGWGTVLQMPSSAASTGDNSMFRTQMYFDSLNGSLFYRTYTTNSTENPNGWHRILTNNDLSSLSEGSNLIGETTNNYTILGSNCRNNGNNVSSVAIGVNSYFSGNNSIAIGSTCSSGINSIAIGGQCYASTFSNSVALGYYVKSSNSSVVIGSNSTATNASGSVVIGKDSLIRANSNYSVAIGYNAIVSSSNSVAIGFHSFVGSSSPWSTAIGYNTKVTHKYSTAIGYNAVSSGNNCIQLGDSTVSSLQCKVSLTITSDERDKIDIEPINKSAVKFLNHIEAFTYQSNQRILYIDEEENLSEKDKENKAKYGICTYDKVEHSKGTKKGSRRRTGVSAQKVQQALEEVYGTSSYANLVNDNLFDYDKDDIPEDVESQLSVNYEGFIPFLIKAIQELNQEIVGLKSEIDSLKGNE